MAIAPIITATRAKYVHLPARTPPVGSGYEVAGGYIYIDVMSRPRDGSASRVSFWCNNPISTLALKKGRKKGNILFRKTYILGCDIRRYNKLCGDPGLVQSGS
jgi:hypothetical protein